jgi:hypothetical protein
VQVYYKLKLAAVIYLGLLVSSISFAQSWQHFDSTASIGWNSIEFNNKFIISSTVLDKVTGISEPSIVILSSNGVKEQMAIIPLSDYGLERGIFTGMASHSPDTLVLAGMAFSRIDSSAFLVIALLNRFYEIIDVSLRKIELNWKNIPSRAYTAKVNLHFNPASNVYYGSTSLCSVKEIGNEPIILSSYGLPCNHIFFIASNSGKVISLKSTPVNINNLNNYLLNKSSLAITKTDEGYLSNSFTEGTVWLNDSLEITKTASPVLKRYFPSNYSNDFIRIDQHYYLIGIVNFYYHIQNGLDRIDLDQNRILVQKFSLNGELVAEREIYPVLLSDSCSWTKFNNGNYIDSYSAKLINAVISGSTASKEGCLMYSYRNQTGKLFVLQIDSNLNTNWSKSINMGYFNFYSLSNVSDSGYVLTGWNSKITLVPLPMFAIKLAPDGYLSTVNSLDGLNKPLVLYPNPFDDSISLKFEDDKFENFDIYIYDSNGSEVLFHKLSGGSSIDTSFLKPGLYFCYIINEMQQKRTFKIIKI